VGQIYTFTSYKYPHTPHRRWVAYGLFPGDGCQLFVRRNTAMRYVGTRRRPWFPEPCWEFVWPDRGYKMALWFHEDGRFGGLYADVCLPPKVDDAQATVDFLDLDLDVVAQEEEGSLQVRVVDREEFARNRSRLHYPGTLSAFAEGALGRLLSDVSQRRYPLDRPLSAWRDELFLRLSTIPLGTFEGEAERAPSQGARRDPQRRQEVSRRRRSL
jgi:protein associated with RNAse G/E